MSDAYLDFLRAKAQYGSANGFDPAFMPSDLMGFQGAMVDWACRLGRGALFADCGMGKTLMQLVWAENVHRITNRPVLVVTPLAVSEQTVNEGAKFGIEVTRSRDGALARGITVTNYERIHYFDPRDFAGVVCDESSILKSFDGATKAALTEFMRVVPYRLACTATAAPNDYMELGTHSEALGYLGYTDMLTRFFTNAQNTVRPRAGLWRKVDQWRFKGHAERPFWQWVASWARAARRPSDLGFEDGAFVLPPLETQTTTVQARTARPGMLFDVAALGLAEDREVRRRTITERCETAAAKVADSGESAIVWCHLNDEADLLERLIPGAAQVSGRDSDEVKEEKFRAFEAGDIRVLVTKPRIGGFGLNWQHCAHVVYFPSDSYEQYYQAVRRCWRFGQKRPVTVDIVLAEGQAGVLENLRRKSEQADRMFADLVRHMREAMVLDHRREFTESVQVPAWL